jgi:hypothetical protein
MVFSDGGLVTQTIHLWHKPKGVISASGGISGAVIQADRWHIYDTMSNLPVYQPTERNQ